MEQIKPFFSIVMPAYNAAEFVSEAIESVLSQSYINWELIIVDDLSSDDTLKIINNYESKDPRIKILQLSGNSGSAYQPRKVAVENAIGEYIVSLDADDTIEPDYLNKVFDRIRMTNAEIIYTKMVNEKMELPVKSFDLNQIMTGKDSVKYTLNGWKIGANGAAIKRSIYIHTFVKYKNNGFEMNADEILTRQLLIESQSVAFATATYFYRINNESITKRIGIHRFSVLETNKQLKDLVYSNFLQNSEERSLIETQCLNSLCSFIRLFYLNRKELKEYSKDLNIRFQLVYNQINWHNIHDLSPLKLLILKQNIQFLKFYIKFAWVVNGILKRRK